MLKEGLSTDNTFNPPYFSSDYTFKCHSKWPMDKSPSQKKGRKAAHMTSKVMFFK
jgi:hypothetical protein